MLDGWEQWGRLNLFAAADAYGAFEEDVHVTMDAALGGFHAAGTWRNDISGPGGLMKSGSGSLTLAGANRYTGGTAVKAGVLAAGSKEAFGRGDVRGGRAARCARTTTRCGCAAGTRRPVPSTSRWTSPTLGFSPALSSARAGDPIKDPALVVDGRAVLERGSSLVVRFDAEQAPRPGSTVAVIGARSLRGRFAEVTVATEGWKAEQVFTAHSVSVRLTKN